MPWPWFSFSSTSRCCAGLAGVLVKNDPVEAADAVVFMAASGPIQTLPFDELARLQHEGLASRILLIESRSSRIVKAGVVPTVESVLRRELERAACRRTPWRQWLEILRIVFGGRPASCGTGCGTIRGHGSRCCVTRRTAGGRPGCWEGAGARGSRPGTLVACPDKRFTTANWWHTRQGICWLGAAYVVLIHTLVQGEAAEDKRWDPDEYEKGLRAGKDR